MSDSKSSSSSYKLSVPSSQKLSNPDHSLNSQHSSPYTTPQSFSTFMIPGKISSSNLSVGKESLSSSEDGGLSDFYNSSANSNLNNSTCNHNNISIGSDIVDGSIMHKKKRSAIEHLQAKITKTNEKIIKEQESKERNVNEYLKLSGEADKQQLQRIKSLFEKKNLKSAQMIGTLQKKLESYNKKLSLLVSDSLPSSGYKSSKGKLKDVGLGLRDFFVRDPTRSRDASPSIAGKNAGSRNPATLPGMNKNRESNIFKGRFGSADDISANILSTTNEMEKAESNDAKNISEDDNELSSGVSDSVSGDFPSGLKKSSSKIPDLSVETSPSQQLQQQQQQNIQQQLLQNQTISSLSKQQSTLFNNHDLTTLKERLQDFQKTQMTIYSSLESMKHKVEEESNTIRQALDEERDRTERLEEQINDLTELHQNEVYNIKQELMGIQEKMEYQLEERTRDIQELLFTCQTKINKMELQQQQQQIISVEGIENTNIRSIITKLINVLLAILAVILLLVSGVAGFIGPFFQTRFRTITSIIMTLLLALLWDKWEDLSYLLETFLPFYSSRNGSFNGESGEVPISNSTLASSTLLPGSDTSEETNNYVTSG